MAGDPAFLFYTGDFTTGTQFLTDEQVGKYLRLLMAQHQHGHLTEKQMMQICKTHDPDIFEKFVNDSNGLFFNQRLELEIIKRKTFTESRANNRRKKEEDTIKIPETHESHVENENENENRIKDEGEIVIEKKQRPKKINLTFIQKAAEIWSAHRIENGLTAFGWEGAELASLKGLLGKIAKYMKAGTTDYEPQEPEILGKWEAFLKHRSSWGKWNDEQWELTVINKKFDNIFTALKTMNNGKFNPEQLAADIERIANNFAEAQKPKRKD